MMYCVYCHTNKLNGKKYIGITCQAVERRWRNGFGYKNGPLYRAIQKYGWDGFEHEILHTGLTEEQAKLKEVELITQHRTRNKHYGYNATDGGDGTSGYKRSDAERAAMSASRKGRHAGTKNPMYGRTGERAPHYGISVSDEAKAIIADGVARSWHDGRHDSVKKRVIGINQQNGLVIEFDSAADASRALGITDSHISRVCRGKRKTAGGYSWRYVNAC